MGTGVRRIEVAGTSNCIECSTAGCGRINLRPSPCCDHSSPAYFSSAPSFPSRRFRVETNGDCYGVYALAGHAVSADGASLAAQFTGTQKWISVALLPTRQDLAFFARYAPVVPRSTTVVWDYSPEKGELVTTWTLRTENLADASDLDVVQGWISHHYDTAHGVRPRFAFNGLTYATPCGLLRCAVGHTLKN